MQNGRYFQISNDGNIWDVFMKEDQRHGPQLYINPDGSYCISQLENGKYVSGNSFDSVGTLH